MILNRVQPSLTLYQLSRKKQEPSNSYSSQQQLLEKRPIIFIHYLLLFYLSLPLYSCSHSGGMDSWMRENFRGAVTVTAGTIVKTEPGGCYFSFRLVDSALDASQVVTQRESAATQYKHSAGVVLFHYILVTAVNI